jgi:hypothetical protein
MKWLTPFAVALVLLASAAMAQPPAVTHLVPGGAQPGKSVDIVFHGANLTAPTGLWTSLNATAELTPGLDKNGTEAGSVSYRLSLPADAPLGVAAVRLLTGQGVSNIRLLLVDDLATIAKSGANKTPATAQALTLPIAVDGASDAESSDFYKFSAAAGQRVSVEVFARRLGSPLDSVVRLLTSAGRELISSDDESSSGADSRFSYRFEAAGEYLVEIRDIRFQGSGAHRYRLRLGDFPLPSVPYPLAAARGTAATVELAGKSVELPGPMSVTMPVTTPGDRVNIAAGYSAGQGSSWVTLVAAEAPDQLEVEPNDTPDKSTAVVVPGAFEGRFLTHNDRDYFQFEAKSGQRLSFVGQTRSLGSPSDLYMRLFNADGGQLAEAEDAGTDEGVLNFTFPADGVYRLRVEDTNRRGGLDEVYRIVVKPYAPGFTLAAAAEKVDAPQNGVFVVKVTATRLEYNGPITLGVEGAGDGCTLRHNVIPEGKPEATMHVTLGKALAAGQWANVKIIGTAKIGDAEFKTAASTLGALRASLAGLPYPPAALDGQLALGVGPVFPSFFQLTAPTASVALPAANKPVNLPVQVTRANKFDDKIDLKIDGLPAPATAKPAAIEKGKADAAIEITSPQPIPPGRHLVRVIGSATFQNQPQEFVLDQIAIEGPPLAIALAAAGPLPVGGKQKATLTLTGQVQPVAAAALYQSGVTRAAEGPRAPAFAGFEGDNRAVSFSGLEKSPGDDRLTASLPIATSGDYTVEMWAYNSRDLSQPNSPAISGYLFSRPGPTTADNAQPGDHLGIGGVESSPRDRLFFYNGQSLASGRTTLPINTWHQVVLVRSGDEVRVYLDGEVGTPEIQTTLARNFNSNQVVFGTRGDGYGPFQGRLDEIAIFDAALPAAQVQAHFVAAKAAAPARDVTLKDNPLVYWRLDETEGPWARSVAPAHKRLVKLAWKNLPPGLAAPDQIVLVDAQDKVDIELAAAASVAAAKLEGVTVAGTTAVGDTEFTAESAPAILEISKP